VKKRLKTPGVGVGRSSHPRGVGGMQPARFISMDEMLGMGFDDLRHSLLTPRSLSPRVEGSLGERFAPHAAGTPAPFGSIATWLSVDDEVEPAAEERELDVFFVGPSAHEAARSAGADGVSSLEVPEALALVSERLDFATLDSVGELLRRRERVIVTIGRSDRLRTGAQASSAESLARWLRQPRPDSAGRETAHTHREEPHTRKRFTRAQVRAVLAFAAAKALHGAGRGRSHAGSYWRPATPRARAS